MHYLRSLNNLDWASIYAESAWTIDTLNPKKVLFLVNNLKCDKSGFFFSFFLIDGIFGFHDPTSGSANVFAGIHQGC